MMSGIQVQQELPKYKCHKEVWALKIKAVEYKSSERGIDVARLQFEERYAPIAVGDEWVDRHKPQVGGYYVVYEDGYKSYSPAEAFESGYLPMFNNTDRPFNKLSRWFDWRHLPEFLQPISKACWWLHWQMQLWLPESAEKTAGLRKVLEAKDCFVRARIEARDAE